MAPIDTCNLNSSRPISLLPEEIQEFQQIVKKVKGVNLTYAEAENQATRMVKLAKLLMQEQILAKQQEESRQ